MRKALPLPTIVYEVPPESILRFVNVTFPPIELLAFTPSNDADFRLPSVEFDSPADSSFSSPLFRSIGSTSLRQL